MSEFEKNHPSSERETTQLKQCPYCAEEVRVEALKCKHCGSWFGGSPLQHEWFRSSSGKIAGVCSGIADEFGISTTVMRLIFMLATFFGGLGPVVYIALWFIMPRKATGIPQNF
jgi:phage shock protein PspC (stress-responsive transcriptional regulator)